jgi:Flp pilus assembly protein TadB
MIRELLDGLTSREQRVLRWSAAAGAAALWLSVAWADLWVLAAVPAIAAGCWYYVARRRRRGEVDGDGDEEDWAF